MQSLKPGIALLIKRVHCPIVPVGITGAFAAWSRHAKLPTPSPLFLQPGPSTIAVSVGKPIDPTRYQGLDREAMLTDLGNEIAIQIAVAERVRRQ
jgi:1-acyl-sn-glycerol-3-phosphate acyltransferase